MGEKETWKEFFKEIAGKKIEPIKYENHPSYRFLKDYLEGELPSGLRSPDKIMEGLKKGQLDDWTETELRAHLMTCTKCSKRVRILKRILVGVSILRESKIKSYHALRWFINWRPAFYVHLGGYVTAFIIGLLILFNPALFSKTPAFDKVQVIQYQPPSGTRVDLSISSEAQKGGKPLSREEAALPIITQIEFPEVIPAEGTEIEGSIQFDSPSNIAEVRAEVKKPEDVNIEKLDFSPRIGEGKSPIKFTLSTDQPKKEIILQIYLINEQGFGSKPEEFKFQALTTPGIPWPILAGPLAFWALLLFFHGKKTHRRREG